jgi:hypothetical protein
MEIKNRAIHIPIFITLYRLQSPTQLVKSSHVINSGFPLFPAKSDYKGKVKNTLAGGEMRPILLTLIALNYPSMASVEVSNTITCELAVPELEAYYDFLKNRDGQMLVFHRPGLVDKDDVLKELKVLSYEKVHTLNSEIGSEANCTREFSEFVAEIKYRDDQNGTKTIYPVCEKTVIRGEDCSH